MKELMGMGLMGWLVSLGLGFIVGGVFFLSIRLQVEYVLKKQGSLWIVPAALYGRMLIMGAVLLGIALKVPREKVAAVMLAGVVGVMVARLLVSRMVRSEDAQPEATGKDSDD
jgi:hypothetical protein